MSKSSFQKESPAEHLLRLMATGELVRNQESLRRLSLVIIHPLELADSPYLAEDDELRVKARKLLDDFEAVSNGMKQPAVITGDPSDPLFPWRILVNSLIAFYNNDFVEMRSLARSIPVKSAPSCLIEVFENLAGKPAGRKVVRTFVDSVFVRQRELEDGLEILEEASAYPHLLRNLTPTYLKAIAAQDRESACRLSLWVLSTLVETAALSEADIELIRTPLGESEALRLASIASIFYDPDLSLVFWLRSLDVSLRSSHLDGNEARARLEIARELWQSAKESELLNEQLITNLADLLRSSYPMLKSLFPALKPIPENISLLYGWLVSAGQTSVRRRYSKHSDKNHSTAGIRSRETPQPQQMLLFNEAKS